MDDIEMNRLADIILRQFERKFLRLPDEWHRIVQTNMMISPVRIPVKFNDPELVKEHHELLLEGYIHDNGGLTLRVKDAWGQLIWERSFT